MAKTYHRPSKQELKEEIDAQCEEAEWLSRAQIDEANDSMDWWPENGPFRSTDPDGDMFDQIDEILELPDIVTEEDYALGINPNLDFETIVAIYGDELIQ